MDQTTTLTTDNVTLIIIPPVNHTSRDWIFEFNDRSTDKTFTRYCAMSRTGTGLDKDIHGAGEAVVFRNLTEDGIFPCQYWKPGGTEINTTTKAYKVYIGETPCWFYDYDDFPRESIDPPASYLESIRYWSKLDYADTEDSNNYRECIADMFEEMALQGEKEGQGEEQGEHGR
jgi:hypothetical protein